jgi:hypothetical protein
MASPNLSGHLIDIRILTDLWPKDIPDNDKFTEILDIEYYTVPAGDGMIHVRYINVHFHDVGKEWRTLPSLYKNQLDVMLHRLELLRRYSASKTLGKEAVVFMKMSLGHLDAILDKAWEEVKASEDKLDQDWRSTVLDAWGVVEHVAGRHDKEHIESHFAEHPDHLDMDAQNLGDTSLVNASIGRDLLTVPLADWGDAYTGRTDYAMTGLTLDGSYKGAEKVRDTNIGFYRRRVERLEEQFGMRTLESYVHEWLCGTETSFERFAEGHEEGVSLNVAIYIYYKRRTRW